MPASHEYLAALGVSNPRPSTVAFDPGYDQLTLEGHIKQSSHLLYVVKLSMATWQLADQASVAYKLKAIRDAGILIISGGGPFEVAASFDFILEYLDLCKNTGFDRIEVGEGFSSVALDPASIIQMAGDRKLSIQYEVGRKFGGFCRSEEADSLCELVRKWLSAGAEQIVVDAKLHFAGDGRREAGEHVERVDDPAVGRVFDRHQAEFNLLEVDGLEDRFDRG